MSRRRLDAELVRRGLARSRSQAAELIEDGSVVVAGLTQPKPASLVEAGTSIEIEAEAPPYVSRGGVKLEGAMAVFPIPVEGRRALDGGASTGGFTDLLLQRGAAEVVAVDVGYGQLAEALRNDPRVRVEDRTNLRHATPESLGGRFDLIVADLSFISLCTVAEALARLAAPDADLVLLVKPQFEVGRSLVGKGGVVRDPASRRSAVESVIDCLGVWGLVTKGLVVSPLPGAKGNREVFVWCRPEEGQS